MKEQTTRRCFHAVRALHMLVSFTALSLVLIFALCAVAVSRAKSSAELHGNALIQRNALRTKEYSILLQDNGYQPLAQSPDDGKLAAAPIIRILSSIDTWASLGIAFAAVHFMLCVISFVVSLLKWPLTEEVDKASSVKVLSSSVS